MEAIDQKLKVEEVAVELGVHPETVKGWIQTGQLKAIKLGHHTVRVRREALEEFCKDREGAKYFMTKEERSVTS